MSGMVARASLAQVRHVTPVPPDTADGLVARVYAQVQRDFGMLAPPISLHSPAPRILAASWLMLRETLLATGLASRAAKEAVAASVSVANSCPYCVDVHSMALHGLVRGRDAVEIASDRIDSVGSASLRQVAAWARAGTRRDAALPLRFLPLEQEPELLGVVATFHYLNRMVNVFLSESPFPARFAPVARGRLRGLVAWFVGRMARKTLAPGDSLELLPAAGLPADLAWTVSAGSVASAFARAVGAVEAGGRRSVPLGVRELVSAELAVWSGEPLGISAAWVEEPLSRLPVDERPAGRLALLTALASYQVSSSVIDEYRAAAEPGDDRLIELTSWASLAAARQATSWARTALERRPGDQAGRPGSPVDRPAQ